MLKGNVGIMNGKNIAIIAAVAVAVLAAVVFKKNSNPVAALVKANVTASAAPAQALPRLVDLGAGKCIPCKMMKPILDDLKVACAETFKTEFIDVWENQDAGKRYGINVIPTQIFYGADGKELFRHEGFFAKADILAKWKELGVEP